MKQKLLLLSLLTLMGSITANAYDFVVDGIYYAITSNDRKEVRVTCQSWYRVSDRDNIPNGYTYHTYSTLIGYDEDDIEIYEYYYDYTTSDYSGTITIPSTVSYNGTTYKVVGINNYAFDNCEALSIDIQSTYIVGSRSIADEAFCNWKGRNFKGERRQLTINCPYLGEAYWDDEEGSVYHLPFQTGYFTDLVLGENVTSIPECAFSRCLQLQTVTLPRTLTSIGESAFDTQPFGNNLNLIFSEIYEPFSFGSNAFWGTSNCTLIVPVGTKDAYIAAGWTEDKFRGGILEGRKTTSNSGSCNSNNRVSWLYLSKEKTLIIYGTSRMDDYNNTSEKVPWYNFRNDIQKVVIKNGVTGIGAYAFEGCNNLTSVTIPNSVTSIGNGYAFSGCTSLSSLTIPNSVTYIGTDAFHNCTGLTSIEIPNSVTSIGYRAFGGCTGLSSIEIPNSVTSIGCGAFEYSSGLTSITIPNSVTGIDYDTFRGCSDLISVTIPNSVTSIGSSAFSGCSSLTSVVSEIEVPFTFGTSAFYNIGSSCTLTVPYGTRDAYIAAGWTEDVFKGGVVEAPLEIVLTDGTTFQNDTEQNCETLSYTRTFNNTNWQALYVPFSMSYDDWKDDFDVGRIIAYYPFYNEDGTLLRAELILAYVKSGSLIPNHPYFIKSKSTGTKTITLTNATLYPSEENSIDCSTVETRCTFTGTYTPVQREGLLVMGGGTLGSLGNATLSPMRWYAVIEDRNSQIVLPPSNIKIRAVDDFEATAILQQLSERQANTIYDLYGRKLEEMPNRKGVYIINGKKVFIR